MSRRLSFNSKDANTRDTLRSIYFCFLVPGKKFRQTHTALKDILDKDKMKTHNLEKGQNFFIMNMEISLHVKPEGFNFNHCIFFFLIRLNNIPIF